MYSVTYLSDNVECPKLTLCTGAEGWRQVPPKTGGGAPAVTSVNTLHASRTAARGQCAFLAASSLENEGTAAASALTGLCG